MRRAAILTSLSAPNVTDVWAHVQTSWFFSKTTRFSGKVSAISIDDRGVEKEDIRVSQEACLFVFALTFVTVADLARKESNSKAVVASTEK